jgi:6-phosphogluconolactonase
VPYSRTFIVLEERMATSLVFVGTYTGDSGSEGIYACRLDHTTGVLSLLGHGPKIENPSFLAMDTKKRRLYSVGELGEGAVHALSYDPANGAMQLLNSQPSKGGYPCHLGLDPKGRYLLTANYGNGVVARYGLDSDGRLEPPAFAQHTGTGPNKSRQEGPHAHSFNPEPTGKLAYACDLGTDEVVLYRVDDGLKRLGEIKMTPGAGPRHFALHPGGKLAYVVNELDLTVTACKRDGRSGKLTPFQSLSTLPRPKTEADSCADIHVAPSGRFVYASNRGHDSIAIFALDAGGKMTALGQEPTQGKTPRNFALSPDGSLLLAANQSTGNVVTFSVDKKTGKLSAIAQVKIPAPVCVKILP